eukprot:m.670932 g.670932  ORF g.670932 m.670932 type:complete len:91 (-) comp58530_c0_seq1:258-530(-)
MVCHRQHFVHFHHRLLLQITSQGPLLLLDASGAEMSHPPPPAAWADQEPASSPVTIPPIAASVLVTAPTAVLDLGGLDEELAALIADPPA